MVQDGGGSLLRHWILNALIDQTGLVDGWRCNGNGYTFHLLVWFERFHAGFCCLFAVDDIATARDRWLLVKWDNLLLLLLLLGWWWLICSSVAIISRGECGNFVREVDRLQSILLALPLLAVSSQAHDLRRGIKLLLNWVSTIKHGHTMALLKLQLMRCNAPRLLIFCCSITIKPIFSHWLEWCAMVFLIFVILLTELCRFWVALRVNAITRLL